MLNVYLIQGHASCPYFFMVNYLHSGTLYVETRAVQIGRMIREPRK